MAQMQNAVVKLALSGDTLILRGAQRGNAPPPERTLGLSFISSPHLGNPKQSKPDEPFSFEAREFLRRRVAGKPIKFVVRHKTAGGREYGSVYLGPEQEDVASILAREGWTQVTEQARNRLKRGNVDDDEADTIELLIDAEDFARTNKRGMWAPAFKSRERLLSFEGDAESFVASNRGKDLRATIEQVRDASTLRVMLHLPHAHQSITLQLAGIRAPSTSVESPEPFGEEARFNVETKLLQQDVFVRIAAPAQVHGSFVGSVIHPAGNITEWLVSAGYARVADWSAAHVEGGATRLRELERDAKKRRAKIWHNYAGDVSKSASAASASQPANDKSFDATVIRIVSGDTLLVHNTAKNTDMEVQLASVRQPRANDPAQAGYAEKAREHLRRQCIGRNVHITIDYTRPPQDGFRERDCATVRLNGEDVGEKLVRAGLATVLRHRNDDMQRSANYDDLLIAATRAQEARVGLHSGKPVAVTKPTEASENATRARSFLSHWQRSGRVPCVVDHINSGSRLRLLIPKDNIRLTLVLGGIRCPRAPRGGDDEGEPMGAEALALAMRLAMQRNAEFEVEGVDKTGGFIGSLWLGKDKSLTEELLGEGLATIHAFSADQSPYSARLYAAEERAKQRSKGLWANKDAQNPAPAAAEPAKPKSAAAGSAPPQALAPRFEFLDVMVSDISADLSTIHVQIAQPSKVAELETLMADLAIAPGAQPASAASDFVPKVGQLVRACYTSGDEWHRARIRSVTASKREFEVVYIDFGNSETLPIDRIRPLPAAFAQKPAFAQEARLAFLRLPSSEFASDYLSEATDELRRLVEGRQLVANVEAREGPSGLMYVTLYDPALGRPVLEKSVNGEIASAGFAVAESKDLASQHNAAGAAKISELVAEARTAHRGMWEYGDITADE
ncbi:hypothetical protein GGI07_002007 [Coemansia sp. Benny D115]|nr:hypothetical protein GGI07_002007 [Coemansia sp. Benny D115]